MAIQIEVGDVGMLAVSAQKDSEIAMRALDNVLAKFVPVAVRDEADGELRMAIAKAVDARVGNVEARRRVQEVDLAALRLQYTATRDVIRVEVKREFDSLWERAGHITKQERDELNALRQKVQAIEIALKGYDDDSE